jgi:hypothetical protein
VKRHSNRSIARALVAAAFLAAPSAAWAGSVRGTVSLIGQGTITIQTGGRPVGVVNARDGTGRGDATFQAAGLGDMPATLQSGEKVRITYRQTKEGILIAKGVSFPGAITASGVVGSIATDGSSLTLQLASGSSLTIETGGLTQLLQGVGLGNTVLVTYVKSGSALTLRSLTVASAPATQTAAAPTVPTPGAPQTGAGNGPDGSTSSGDGGSSGGHSGWNGPGWNGSGWSDGT